METLSPLLTSLQRCCDALADLRRPGPNTRYTMADFGLAAFSVFFMQSPSFLAHQRHLEQGQGRSNCRSLFGMTAIPCDNQIRAMLDPVDPALFFPVFADVMGTLERTGGLNEFRRLNGRVLIALDGAEYFRTNSCTVRAVRRGHATPARPSSSIPCCPLRWSRPAISASCRSSRSSSCRRTATTSRTARAGQPGAGSASTPALSPLSTRG